ncbi:MAG: RNA polymerase subunit sigma, partial [Planctomycetes bacterium]|nr:RNA polymerase subunit sigma [Planctomycetota bacterium]
MAAPNESVITLLLDRIGDGDAGASNELLGLVYDQLRVIADRMFVRDGGHTLQPTAIVHEAWLKLAPDLGQYEGRRHFFAVAAKAMRQVLADHARAASRRKRGGGRRTVTLDDAPDVSASAAVDLLALHECL